LKKKEEKKCWYPIKYIRTWNLSRYRCSLGTFCLAWSISTITWNKNNRSLSTICCPLVFIFFYDYSNLSIGYFFYSIGYPMVTLGFGFKTYLAYKWRLVKISFLLLIPYFYFLTRGNNVMYGKRMKLILS
jgi:hypothetical protein